jgi:hypothetical protein
MYSWLKEKEQQEDTGKIIHIKSQIGNKNIMLPLNGSDGVVHVQMIYRKQNLLIHPHTRA